MNYFKGGVLPVNVHQANGINKLRVWSEIERDNTSSTVIRQFRVALLDDQHITLWNTIRSWPIRFSTSADARSGRTALFIRTAKVILNVGA
jgi:hypothetical protein